MNRGDYQETLPIIQFDMVLEVKPPRGGEIEYEKHQAAALHAARQAQAAGQMGQVRPVPVDGQPANPAAERFVAGYQSMDTDTHAYDMTKQAFYDGRILAPAHAKAQKELITLEYRRQEAQDRPSAERLERRGSDAMAGVVFGLTMRREIWLRHRHPAAAASRRRSPGGKNSVTAHEKSPEAYMDLVRKARGVEWSEARR